MTKMKFVRGLWLLLLTSFTSLQAKEMVWDYIIVGNGSAGSILARKLSDNNKKKVLVLEAGVNQDDDPVVLDFDGTNFLSDLWDLSFNPKYAITYNIQVFNPLQVSPYSEGLGWGGSSKHNFFVAVRGTQSIYDHPITGWAAISGNSAWSYSNMLPLMKALENYVPCMTAANPAQRGVGGPISLSQLPPITADPLSQQLAIAIKSGFLPDYNDPTSVNSTGGVGADTNVGVSPVQAFATLDSPCAIMNPFPRGTRSFSSRSFLPPSIVARAGSNYYVGTGKRVLRIQDKCRVSRVLFKGKKAKGVEFVFDNGKKTGTAYGKKIILCAGAINSAAILQRSGVGDPAILNPLGIKVLINNPNVGANLQCQYGAAFISNVLSTAVLSQVYMNLSSNPAFPMGSPFEFPNDSTRRVQANLLPGPMGTEFATFLLQPRSRGFLKIVSTDPLVQPFIDLGMYTDDPSATPWLDHGSDANLMVTAGKILNNATMAAGGMMVQPPAAFFMAGNENLLFLYLKSPDGLSVADHILGTTRMGTSSATGVVDGNLHVFGVKNLMIADLGVLPNSPDGNTGYAAYLVGLRACTILGVPVPPAL